jgi:chitodextrinase
VSAAKPKANYGSTTRLKADATPTMDTYVRFSGGSFTGQITRATLWMYGVTSSDAGYAVHAVSDTSWNESSITYANAPLISPTTVGSAGGFASGTWTPVDVTSIVSAAGAASLAVTSPATSALNFSSRETGAKSPVLVVETTSPDVSPPTAPTGLAVTATTGSSISLSWNAASDNVAVAGYGVYRNGSLVTSTQQTTQTLSGLACGTSYSVGVDAYDTAGNRSAQATLMVSTAPCPDTISPTDPTGLTVTSASATAISLSWNASTDNVGVPGYNVFLGLTKVASTNNTNYTFTGLTCGTSYNLGVQAYDAAGNRSAQVFVVAATSPCLDSSAPTAPTGLLVSASTATSISAVWNPSFDNVGVSGYDLFVNGSKIGTTPLTNYTFASLTCGTSYTLGVAAYDAAGNRSTRTSVTAATSACASGGGGGGGGTAPSIKYRFAYSNTSDQDLMPQYGFNLIDVSTKSEADATPAGTQGQLWLYDYDNNKCTWEKDDTYIRNMVSSVANDPKVAGFYFSNEPDPFACPNAPQQHKDRHALIKSLAPTKYTLIGIDTNWREHFDNYGTMWKGAADYVNYNPYICYVGKPCDYAWEDHVLQVAESLGQPYFVTLQAFKEGTEWRWPTAAEETDMLNRLKDSALSHLSGYMTFSWNWQNDPLLNHPDVLNAIKDFNLGTSSSPGDTTAPTAPTGLSTTATTATSVTISWNASSDNVGVTGYHVYRNGTLASTTSGTTATIGGLTCGTSYTFSVDAYDAAGNKSSQASIVAATAACGDTTAPTTPTSLKATGATSTSVSFSWAASSDNVGVAGYGIYRGGTRVATTTPTSYTMSGLSCGTSYSIGVDAYDAAGNRSGQATITIATSACDTTAPAAPGSLTVTTTTQTSVAIMWNASIDNVGVTGYDVYSNGTKVGSVSGTNYTFNGLTCGTNYTLGVEAYDAAGNHSTRSTVGGSTAACSSPPPPPPSSSDPVITAAGDICGSPTDCDPTAKLIEQISPTRVLTLGDNAYPDGTSSNYSSYYDPNWGRFKSKTSPAPGNHDYHTSGGSGYFGYFGSQAPGEYYSYDLGSWHLISLNGEISVSAGSAQETWLKNDLAAHSSQCILAYWHEPRFSSGSVHGSNSSFDPFWRDLYAAGADIVLNGHDHEYERFAKQNPSGSADSKGIREFVVGTGGAGLYTFGAAIANSEVRNNTSFGVLKLTLHSGGYDWQFLPVAGASFTDSGSDSC